MRTFKLITYWVVTRLTRYSYNSDYRTEQEIISRMFENYKYRFSDNNKQRYFWRAICQYRCQNFARKPWAILIANLLSLMVLPVIVVILLFRQKKISGSKILCRFLKIDTNIAYQIPECIKEKTQEAQLSTRYLLWVDVRFVLGLFLHHGFIYPELLFKFILWVSSIRPYVEKYEFQCLIQYCEYSAYSSLRKIYLNSHGIQIANVTHGEEVISCRSAFSSFDQYYAWELTPRSIHDVMHIECGDRFVFNPCAGMSPAPKSEIVSALGFLWPSVEGPDLDLLIRELNQLNQYYHVIVRPHPNPNYQNHFARYRDQLTCEVSEANSESIHNFIDRSGLMIGFLSAALIQARFRGRDTLYLKDAYLESLSEYHDYYKNVTSVALEELSSFLLKPQQVKK